MATSFQPPPPPPPQKSKTLLWVLVGVGGFFLLIALVVVGGIAYVARNPAAFMTKVITAANPNVEVLSVDKGSQQVILRDKKTGKTYNITFDDVKKGRFSMQGSDGHSSFSIGGDAKIPAWVPDYPGSHPQAAFAAKGDEGESGTFTFKTSDSEAQVAKFYRDQFQSLNMHVTRESSTSGNGSAITAEDEAKNHTITAIVREDGSQTSVSVTYARGR
ncbi:MAG TPA: hypothetical protein VKT81_10470 [Bryobacteraceae bacterium]|nr:hypothetical protein [Bryobacteraceae bacterium]